MLELPFSVSEQDQYENHNYVGISEKKQQNQAR